tara:strand:+ start:200 stop:469 length:270 start_codon:yes stop_codon:yes gene_type:complete
MFGARLEDFTIDQFAGSLALILGSVGGLLMIIWKSRCECDLNCCYVWRCHRKPPPENLVEDDDEETETIKASKSKPLIEEINSTGRDAP